MSDKEKIERTDFYSRVKYFSAIKRPTLEDVENGAWDNTKGDSPVLFEKIRDHYAWRVVYVWDENLNAYLKQKEETE